MVERVPYEEFGLLQDNAEEFGIRLDRLPSLRREDVEVSPARNVSSIVWGDDDPEFVFLHGGGQNAHTWDTVALALGRSAIAVDLPGHGHSDAQANPDRLSPEDNAVDVSGVIRRLAPNAAAVIGMSLGGLTTIALVDHAPELVERMVLVDVTPGVTSAKSKAISNFVQGPAKFADFDQLLARTIEHNPGRTESSLRRGILHNALQLDDGSWMWRYRRFGGGGVVGESGAQPIDFGRLWEPLGASSVPVLLVRGMLPQSVVDDADVAEFLRRRPDGMIIEVPNAGHSVQGDTPVELAAMIQSFAS